MPSWGQASDVESVATAEDRDPNSLCAEPKRHLEVRAFSGSNPITSQGGLTWNCCDREKL